MTNVSECFCRLYNELERKDDKNENEKTDVEKITFCTNYSACSAYERSANGRFIK